MGTRIPETPGVPIQNPIAQPIPTQEIRLKEVEGPPCIESEFVLPSKSDLALPALSAIIALWPTDSQHEIQQTLTKATSFTPLLDKINIFLSLTADFGDVRAPIS